MDKKNNKAAAFFFLKIAGARKISLCCCSKPNHLSFFKRLQWLQMSTQRGSGVGGGDDPTHYHQQQQQPSSGSASGSGGGALTLSTDSFSAADLSFGSYGSSSTSGVVSGDGGESGGLHQKLVAAGLAVGGGVSREQGVRDLRSIIQ